MQQPDAQGGQVPQIAREQRRFSPRTASIYFLGVLLAITLKATYDGFFQRIGTYDTFQIAWEEFIQNFWLGILFLAQFLVYSFTLFRFYWGSYRYLRIEPTQERPHEVLIDIVGLILLFTGFYITGLCLKTTYLFYYGIVLVHVFAVGWFWLANLVLKLEGVMKRIIFVLMTFYGLTILFLSVLKLIESFFPRQGFLYQFIALGILLVAGIFDFWYCWAFYTDREGWERKFP